MDAIPMLNTPLRLGGIVLKNRLFRAPMLEGAGISKDPAAIYAKHFVPNADAGVGLIIQGTTCITPEGRPSPGMTAIDTREDMMRMEPMTRAVHRAGAHIIIQLGHGGMHCIESWHRRFKAQRRSLPLAPGAPGIFQRIMVGKVHVLSTKDTEALVQRFATVALWAREAGYDGIEIAAANAKLLHQFLSRTYNQRDDRYGGSLWRRTAILREIRAAIAERAGSDFPVTLKYPAQEEGFRPGISLEEGLQIAKIAEEAGYDGLTPVSAPSDPNPAFCRGDFPQASFENPRLRRMLKEAVGTVRTELVRHIIKSILTRFPYEEMWNLPVFEAVKRAVSISVSAVGGIRTREAADGLLERGQADLIGIGRPFYADPDLARMFLDRGHEVALKCNNCNRCLLPQLLGHPGVCYNPDTHRKDTVPLSVRRAARAPGAASASAAPARVRLTPQAPAEELQSQP